MQDFHFGVAARRRWALILACIGIALCALLTALPCRADGLDSLARFLRETHSGTAQFTQVVTPPPGRPKAADAPSGGSEPRAAGSVGANITPPPKNGLNGQQPRRRTQNGAFAFKRPGQFRFDYQAPFAQTIVADGTTLWLYDADLNQVTARPQAQTLASTPAALIATATDLKALQRDYALTAESDQGDGLQWIKAVPKPRDDDSSGALQSVRVGLKASPGGAPALAALDILDSLGQRSQITFSAFEVNPAIAPARFHFTPPPGADVVKE